MLLRKPLPLWLGVSVFAASIAMVSLGGQLRRPSSSPPRTMAELIERLSQCTPPLYAVPQFQEKPDHAMWACTHPQSREQLGERLVRDPERAKRGLWQGIVFCEPKSEVLLIEDEFIQDHWGEYGMRIGPFILFGDRDLLQRIRVEIFGYGS